MTGSQAPQHAIRRLALLGGRSERLGSALASSPLLDDPIAILTGVTLDESALEAVLLRLEGNAAGSTAAAAPWPRAGIAARRARRRTSPIAPALRAEAADAPVDVRVRPRQASEQHVRVPRARIAAPVPAPLPATGLDPPARPSRAAARAGSHAPGSPSATSSLAGAAARVPGGAAAIVTPLAAEWTSADPVAVESAFAESEPVGVASAPTLLEAVLARAGTDTLGTDSQGVAQPQHGRPSVSASEPGDRLPYRRSLADALAPSRVAAQLPVQLPAEPSLSTAAPVAAPWTAEDAEVDDTPFPAGSGGSGLAELVRRWEVSHGRDRYGDRDPAGTRIEPGRDPVAGVEAESALARAVERLLAAELRRSGIEVDVG